MKLAKEPFALIKWPGGKASELDVLLPIVPEFKGRFIDPFVGGGSFLLGLKPKVALINDLSAELMSFYQYVKLGNGDFFAALKEISKLRDALSDLHIEDLVAAHKDFSGRAGTSTFKEAELRKRIIEWVKTNNRKLNKLTYNQLAPEILTLQIEQNLIRKITRLRNLKTSNTGWKKKDAPANIETALHSSFYMYIRHLYNYALPLRLSPPVVTALFYFLREFCYSAMFRFNKKGEFNVPYGGMAYNRKNFTTKLENLARAKHYLVDARISNLDFEEFIRQAGPTSGDFLFLDPPYDSDFSTYDQNDFNTTDHVRLANILRNTTASFLLVIKKTNFVTKLYGSIPGTKVSIFEKTYAVSFQNRNIKTAQHLVFVNYKPKESRLQVFAG